MIQTLIPILGPIFGKVIDRVIPDKAAAEEAKLSMELELIKAANAGALAQLEVNKAEAQHRSIFVAGWRPAIGWTCAFALFWTYIGVPILSAILMVQGVEVDLPTIDMDYLLELVFGMLGLAGMRSWEKSRGLTR